MKRTFVSPHWLHENLSNPELIILDASMDAITVDSNTEIQDVQIKGARFFDLRNVFRDTENVLPNTFPDPEYFTLECRKLGINKNSKIVVYDNKGIYSSPRVWWLFQAMGHENIAVLDGGLPGWIASKYPLESKKKNVHETGDFEARLQPDWITKIESVVENLENKEAIILDARSAGRFNGTAPEPRAGLAGGHIPNSKSLPYTAVLEDGKYKSKEELAGIFNDLNLDNKPLIFTCGSGITACIIALAAQEVLNNKKSIFDGSWTEWALADNLPIDGNTDQ